MGTLPKEIKTPETMRSLANSLRQERKSIALVPTMGALHEGHASLLRVARKRADFVVLSVFVNPTQFAKGEDLSSYPRTYEADLALAASCGVDAVYAPSADAMYPAGYQSLVRVPKLAEYLCGASREGHFDGVATVVSKLFNACMPHVAVFGEKDFQQLALLRQLNLDLDFGVEIVGAPIVREADGLAMSSRNQYLQEHQRNEATRIYSALKAAKNSFELGERDASALVASARAVLESASHAQIEYLSLVDPTTLEAIQRVESHGLLAAAVRFGTTRLIDNLVLQ